MNPTMAISDLNFDLLLFFLLLLGMIILAFISNISPKNKTRDFSSTNNKKSDLVNDLVSDIYAFQTTRNYKLEGNYHSELYGWLKKDFPNIQAELQTNSSRPDLVIEDIAIEIKGPTTKKDIITISDKLLRYFNHYQYFILVFFDIQITDAYFDDWYAGVKKHFPNLILILMNVDGENLILM